MCVAAGAEESGCLSVLISFCRPETTACSSRYSVSNGEMLGGTSLTAGLTETLMPSEDNNTVLVHVEAEAATSGALMGSKLLSEVALEIPEKDELWLSLLVVVETNDGTEGTTEVSCFAATECGT